MVAPMRSVLARQTAVRPALSLSLAAALALQGGCGPEPTESFALRSEAIGDAFDISVRVPPGSPPAAGWPLVVVLDASWHLQTAQERLEQLIDTGRVSQALLAGIGHQADVENKRLRDFAVPEVGGPSAGGRAFLDFVEETLLPELARRYPIDGALTRRILIGHSLGGLLAAQALFRRPQLFGGFGLAAPAFWNDDWRIFAIEIDYAARNRDLPAAVVMKTGFQDGPEITVGVPAFARKLESRQYPGLRLVSGIVPDQSHTSILPGFLDDALTQLLGEP
jgi:uncharacterized protein